MKRYRNVELVTEPRAEDRQECSSFMLPVEFQPYYAGEYETPAGDWIRFRGIPSLMKIERALDEGPPVLRRLIWSMQDGYGTPGVVPPQGHDWSGIRDSKDATIEAMARCCDDWWRKSHPGESWPWELPEVQKGAVA